MDDGPWSVVHCPKVGESGWESNPPRLATRPATGFEDLEAHRDLTTPRCKDNRRMKGLQASLPKDLTGFEPVRSKRLAAHASPEEGARRTIRFYGNLEIIRS